MNSNSRQRRIRTALGILTLSVLLHASLLFLPLPELRREAAPPESTALVIDLVTLAPEAREVRQETPEPERPPQSVMPAEDVERPRAEAAESRSEERQTAREASTPPTASPSDAEAPPARIRAQLLGAARTLGREAEEPPESNGLEYRDTPDLPSGPGWLDQYTGRVTASVERWQGNDGSRSARIVTGSGQVICVRTRAPTTGEIFNPWMSAAVPMMRDCGRERPEGPDPKDPWLRRPGEGGE